MNDGNIRVIPDPYTEKSNCHARILFIGISIGYDFEAGHDNFLALFQQVYLVVTTLN